MKGATSKVSWIAVSVLVLTCVLGVLAYALQYTNINRDQYDQALTKWRSQNALEYEMVIDNEAMFNAGTWTLRVHSDGDKVELVNQVIDGTPVALPPAATGEALMPLTVEGLFSRIDEMLTMYAPIDFEARCTVSFELALGYPTDIECHPKPWVSKTDSDTRTLVKSLTILKRKTSAATPTP